MNEKFNKNAKVEKFTTMLGIAVRLIVIDPLYNVDHFAIRYLGTVKHFLFAKTFFSRKFARTSRREN